MTIDTTCAHDECYHYEQVKACCVCRDLDPERMCSHCYGILIKMKD